MPVTHRTQFDYDWWVPAAKASALQPSSIFMLGRAYHADLEKSGPITHKL